MKLRNDSQRVREKLVGSVRPGPTEGPVREWQPPLAEAARGAPSDAENKEILRLIRNSTWEHSGCALRRGRYGMDDYGQLGRLLSETRRAILMARNCPELRPTNTSHFHSLAHEPAPDL